MSSGVRDVTLVTHICSHSDECLQFFVTKLGIVVHHMSHNVMQKNGILSSRSRSQCGLI